MSRYWLRGRRRGDRRRTRRQREYVDRYTRNERALAIGILALCFIDAVMTLLYLAGGGEEANPVMQWALEHGVDSFIALKMGYTLFAVFFLLMHVRFGFTKHLTAIVFALYYCLTAYHVFLRASMPL